MKKYINMDFDEKGKPVLGRAKNTATGGFVPTMWIPGASDGGSGIKSISISPSISITPALDTFHVYWEDLTPGQQSGEEEIEFEFDADGLLTGPYAATYTPTEGWFAGNNESPDESYTKSGIEPSGSYMSFPVIVHDGGERFMEILIEIYGK